MLEPLPADDPQAGVMPGAMLVGDSPLTIALMCLLAAWAKRLS
jgi:hypothetical protein